MAAARGGLFIPIVGDEASLARALERAHADLRRFAGQAQTQGTKAATGLGRIGTAAKGFGSRVLSPLRQFVPALGLSAIVAFGATSSAAFREAEQAGNQLAQTFQANRTLADSSVTSIERLAGAIAAKTAAEDDSIISGAAVLGNFRLTGRQLEATVPLLVDYARKTGWEVPGAAKTLGKAFLGNTRALKDLGIAYKPTGDSARDFAAITEALRRKVGGFAASEMTTTEGKLENLRNRFGNLQETIGSKVIGTFGFLAQHIGVVGPILGSLTSGIVAYKLATLVATVATQGFGVTLNIAAGPIALVAAALVGLGIVAFKFRDRIIGAVGKVRDFFVRSFGAIGSFLHRWRGIILPIVLGPVGLIIAHWGRIKDGIVGAFRFVRDKVLGFLRGLREGFSGAAAFIGAVFAAPINLVIDGLNFLIRGLNRIHFRTPDWVPVLGGKEFGFNLPEIPRLAAGGIVMAPTLALLGEAGPEAVVPLGRGGGGPTIVVHVHVAGSVTAERDLARSVRDELVRLGRRNVTTGL